MNITYRVTCPRCHAPEIVMDHPVHPDAHAMIGYCKACEAQMFSLEEHRAAEREYLDTLDVDGDDNCGGGGESGFYRESMQNAGRGHLLT